jgi:LysR family transcriptional regulator, glycine cleavage system transcriptional activator
MRESDRRLLPPIGALASFVSAARHNSFSRAGDEMGLTQSAVSRQIALLEDWLQTSLFERKGRRVALSRDGEAYLNAIGPALDRIRSATLATVDKVSDRELNIATLPGFGMRWLAPRLGQLTSLHPDIIVNIAARSFPFNFADEPFDAAVHFGLPDWPEATHDILFREEAIPVCSPDLVEPGRIVRPRDVLKWPLLALSSRRDAWTRWLGAAGESEPPPPPSAIFEHFLMLAQAAAAGTGIALIPKFLIEPELAEGTLVCPLPISVSGEEAYYLVCPANRARPQSRETARVGAFPNLAADGNTPARNAPSHRKILTHCAAKLRAASRPCGSTLSIRCKMAWEQLCRICV